MDDPTAPSQPGETRGTSRRWLLIGGALTLLSASGGLAVEFLRPVTGSNGSVAPRVLLLALAAEQSLLETTDAALRAQPSLRATLAQLRRDHHEHERALAAAVTELGRGASRPTPRRSPAGPQRRSLDRAGLRSVEEHAAIQAAQHATALTGPAAALLASISACEATHAELLA